MIFAILAALHVFAAVGFESEMSDQDKKKTGLYKLTDKEKTALEQWIDTNYQKRSSEEESSASRHRKNVSPTLSENLLNSNYLRLSDDTLWNIRPEDVPIAQSWITPVEIVVSKSSNPFFPNRLTNKVTGTSIQARKVDKLPRASPQAPLPKPTTETETF